MSAAPAETQTPRLGCGVNEDIMMKISIKAPRPSQPSGAAHHRPAEAGASRMAGALLAASLVLAALAVGLAARHPAHPPQEPPVAPPAVEPGAGAASATPTSGDPLVARGQALFARQCSVCHGESGDGAGRFAYLMNPRPRDFRQGRFKLATTQNLIPTEADLIRTISRGMPGSAMPPWGHLPNADLAALARYVRQVHVTAVRAELALQAPQRGWSEADLEREVAARTQPGPPIMVPPEPVFDDLRWFRGRRIYLEACAACHGADGQPVAANVKYDSDGYPVPPRSFVNGIFKGGSESHQLYVRVLKGLPGTPMPAYESAYAEDELWDLVHYTQSLARAGAQDRAQLRQGTFVAARVPRLPPGPRDPTWDQARPLYVALTPLWWAEDRIDGVTVQALHDGTELALRVSWLDPTPDERAVRHDEFRDAVAVQFSLSPDPPFYMGDRDARGGVNIWMWKADRQRNIATGYQDVDAAFPFKVVDRYPEQGFRITAESGVEPPKCPITDHDALYVGAWGAGNLVANPTLRTPVECLVASGPGTLTGKPAELQVVGGQGVYERGVWYVQMQRTMELPHAHHEADERAFSAGDYLPVSIAIWNGSAGDRDGKKNISIWQKLVIE